MILIVASISMPYYERIIMHGHEAMLREDLFTMRVQGKKGCQAPFAEARGEKASIARSVGKGT